MGIVMNLFAKLRHGTSHPPDTHTAAADFRPSNDLEQALAHAQAGTMSVGDFFARLSRSQVAILLDREVPQSGWDNGISPLILKSPRGTDVLAMFTSVERATPTSQKSERHKYALLIDFSWVLKGIASGVGVVINPGWPVGVEIEPARVAELKKGAQ